MRNSATLEALFPKTREGVLAATLTQPDKWWFLSELAEYLGTTPSSLQRELFALADTGILEQRREGNRAYFRAQKRSPIYRELRAIFEKTTGIAPTIRTAVVAFGGQDPLLICVRVRCPGARTRGQRHRRNGHWQYRSCRIDA